MKFSKITRHLNMKDVNRKQLQKEEALKEEPTNSTSNVYPETSEVPNQDFNDFEAIMTGGQRLGFSGADGNTAGNASIGDSGGFADVALSPPHPVTGLRIAARHVRDGTGGTTPLRPGKTITRGFSNNPPSYTMGSVLWFYDMDFDNGAGQPAGKWCNLEFSNFDGDTNGKWFFWDTIKPPSTLAGFYFANTDLSQHPCGDISDLIDGLNFPGIGGSLGAAKIPVLTVKGLETEPIYPGPIANLFGLGQRAFDWMKGKAEDLTDKIKDVFDDAVEGLNDLLDELGDAINNFDGTPVESNPDYTDLYDGIKDGMDLLNNVQDVLKDSPKDENGNIEAGAEGSKENPLKNSVSDTTARTILKGIDLNTKPEILSDIIGVYIQNNVSAKPGAFGGRGSIGAKGTHNNLPGMGKQDGGYPAPYINENGDIVIPDTYAFRPHTHENRWLPKATEALIDTVNAHTNFYVNDDAKQEALDWAATVMDQNYAGAFIPDIPGRKDPIVHFETIIPKEQVDRIKANQSKSNQNESYISESAKLGHFEPDILDVDINDIRKGIMPEYPKQPPAEMIDGYHQKSPLRPKPLNNEPYVKITKADLIRNHRIKPSEVDEMMDTINRLNDYIKKHPEDLIYVQQRYPKDDPRLAELNWKMDQMLEAGKDYLDKNFKENSKLFKRAMDRTKNNIKLTDPKYAQQRYDELRGTVKPKKTNLVGRLGKHLNKYESKGVLRHVDSDDFKKINEQKIERKKQVKQIQNEIKIEFQEKKSDWRKDLSNNTH